MRRNARVLLAALALSLIVPGLRAASPTTKDYGDIDLVNWQSGHEDDIWDLTLGPLTMSYTIDMSGIVTPGWAVNQVGLRQEGGADLDPNNLGGWMQSNYLSSLNRPTADTNDFHLLSKHGWMYQYYDLSPNKDAYIGQKWWGLNYAFWFDRGPVDQWQDDCWNYKDGVTYNTGGVYDVVIQYDYSLGQAKPTMFATLNGADQGFYSGGYGCLTIPQTYPAGRLFDGDAAHMQVFYGRGGGGGTVKITDLTVTGYIGTIYVALDVRPGSDSNQINTNSKMLVPIAILSHPGFDPVAEVDINSIVIHGATAAGTKYDNTIDWNLDGVADLTLYFRARAFRKPGDECGDPNAHVEVELGYTYNGAVLRGSDSVTWLGPDCD